MAIHPLESLSMPSLLSFAPTLLGSFISNELREFEKIVKGIFMGSCLFMGAGAVIIFLNADQSCREILERDQPVRQKIFETFFKSAGELSICMAHGIAWGGAVGFCQILAGRCRRLRA